MNIPKCKNCGMKFKYKNLLFVLFRPDSLKCRNCGAVHEMNFISRIIPSVLIILPIIMRNSIKALLPTMSLVYIAYLFYLIIIIIISPYIFRYKLKNINGHNKWFM